MSWDVPAFLERFAAFGSEPSVESYLALFHPDATLFDAGMPAPIGVDAIPEHFETILRVIPDLQMVPERWREDAGTVFVEASNRASIGASPVHWRSIYCVDLSGGHVIRGRRYYDRRTLFAHLDPGLPALPKIPTAVAPLETSGAPVPIGNAGLDALASSWKRGVPGEVARFYREDGTARFPGQPHPLVPGALAAYTAGFAEAIGELDFTPLGRAGDDGLGFLEWEARVGVGDEVLTLRGTDRYDWAPGGILASRRYYDTLELANRLAGDDDEAG